MHFLAKNLDLSESYNRIDKYDIIASSYSTLAYEAFSRGSKTCFFSFPNYLDYRDRYFAWPYNKKNKDFFFTNVLTLNEIDRILKN